MKWFSLLAVIHTIYTTLRFLKSDSIHLLISTVFREAAFFSCYKHEYANASETLRGVKQLYNLEIVRKNIFPRNCVHLWLATLEAAELIAFNETTNSIELAQLFNAKMKAIIIRKLF